MRTSRIARETERVANALSQSRRTSGRLSSRNTAYEAANGSIREERSHGSSPDDASTTSTSLGKRKRHADTPAATKVSEALAVRQSPHKNAKAEDSKPPRKARRQPAKHIEGPDGSVVAVEPPLNWEKLYNTTAAMRKRILAPVDTMGCESLAETHRSPQDQRLQTLVSLMLSSQTKDTVTAAAMKNLQDNLRGGFCLESLLKIEPEELNRLIEKVGFHNNKTKFIKSTAVILRDDYKSDIPDTIDGLVSLPGVGPKMAYLCMSAAWGRDEGIGVDVHVHRITNLWGWHKTSTPEQTRAELEAWLPRERWHDINHLLVGFGQTVCLPVGRRCGECDLSVEGLCPSAVVGKSPVKKRVKKEVVIDDGKVVKSEEVMEQSDDVGVKLEADLADEGKIEIQDMVG